MSPVEGNMNLFEILSAYHADKNLNAGLKHEIIKDGVMFLSSNDDAPVPAEIGDENGQKWYKGFLIFSNGADVAEHLRDAGIIKFKAYKHIGSPDEFCSYLDVVGKDGALVYDRPAKRLTKGLLTPPDNSSSPLEDILPDTFLSEQGIVPFYDADGFSNIGARTKVAFEASRGFHDKKDDYHHLDAHLIKHTIYNDLGFGPVVKISQGDMYLFFMKYAPSHDGPFINKDHDIIGVVRHYVMKDGRFMQQSEHRVYFDDGRMLTLKDKPLFVSPS